MRRGTFGRTRGGLRQFAAKRFARIGECVLNQIFFLAALRQRDLDLVADLGAQRLGQELPVRNRM